jgi:hypothetical protein
MWRNPLAYGHATATRIFRGLGWVTGANDREWRSRGSARGPHGHRSHDERYEERDDEPDEESRTEKA